jgi:hypothetical protein
MDNDSENFYYSNKKKPELNWYGKGLMEKMSETEMYCNLASFLSSESRLKLFEEYCKVLGTRIPERIWQDTGIRKTDVYRYFSKTKFKRGGHIPDPETCAKFIIALQNRHEYALVRELIEPALNSMKFTIRRFDTA